MNNCTIEDYIYSFYLYLINIRNFSKSTAKEYRFDVIFFMRFLACHYNLVSTKSEEFKFQEVNINCITDDILRQITKEDIISYLFFLTNNEYCIDTKDRKFYGLKSFLEYLYSRKHIIFNNPAKEIVMEKNDEKLPIYLTKTELNKFFKAIDKDSLYYKRNLCILTLIATLGLRICEISNLDIDDINFSEKTIQILGKGNKKRVLYLDDNCIKTIQDYLEFRESIINEDIYDAGNALFISRQQKRISRRTIQVIVSETLKRAKLDGKHYSAHKIRHTTATLLLQSGIDIRNIQTILGHSSIVSTQIYTHINDKSIKKGFESNPLANYDRILRNEEAN